LKTQGITSTSGAQHKFFRLTRRSSAFTTTLALRRNAQPQVGARRSQRGLLMHCFWGSPTDFFPYASPRFCIFWGYFSIVHLLDLQLLFSRLPRRKCFSVVASLSVSPDRGTDRETSALTLWIRDLTSPHFHYRRPPKQRASLSQAPTRRDSVSSHSGRAHFGLPVRTCVCSRRTGRSPPALPHVVHLRPKFWLYVFFPVWHCMGTTACR
jgi:hypothetical protein